MNDYDDNEFEDAGAWLPDVPNVWTDGSLVREEVSSGCSGGAGENWARLWVNWWWQQRLDFFIQTHDAIVNQKLAALNWTLQAKVLSKLTFIFS